METAVAVRSGILDTARQNIMRSGFAGLVCAIVLGMCSTGDLKAAEESRGRYLSPSALAVGPDDGTVFVACSGGEEVLAVDVTSRSVRGRFRVAGCPSGVTVTADGKQLLVTCAADRSTLLVLDAATGKQQSSIALGHTAMAPMLSRDGKKAYVCYRFDDCVGVIDLESGKEVRRIAVAREPVGAVLTLDGKHLLVAHHLHSGAANVDVVAPRVSVLDCASGKLVKELALPSGTTAVNDIRISPDGHYAVVTHVLGRFHVPAAQLERGWMNTNAKTVIDVARMEVLDTVLLDSVDSGAANPWGAAWSKTGERLVVAHAGSHEVSVVNFPAVIAKLKVRREQLSGTEPAEQMALEPSNDLAFLAEARKRIRLPESDRGPRAIVVVGKLVVTANYFSDSLTVVDLSLPRSRPESIRLGPVVEMDEARRGEFFFHDAGICFQGWQSCASCHPGEGRVDALNWDLLNDGIGNPKNSKSLLLSHRTPPAMSMGVRDTAEAAVRAGIRNILMTVQPESVARALDTYLKSLKPVPSPKLVDGKLSPQALRGERVFRKANCANCHPKESLYTDLQAYDVGTRTGQDRVAERFDTPTLVEVWRTAPYLHDGSASTIRAVLTTHNRNDQHGDTSPLSEQELADLCEYVLSL